MKKIISYYGIGIVNGKRQCIFHNEILDCEKRVIILNETKDDNIGSNEKEILDELYNFLVEINANWIELSKEIRIGCDCNCENNILFANIQIDKHSIASFPIGINYSQIDINRYDYFNKIVKLFRDEFRTSSASIISNKFILDPFSTGIFVHEIIGHIAEQEKDLISKIRFENISIMDMPNSILNYSFDDRQNVGQTVNIVEDKLNINSGNCFYGISSKNTLKEQIRQRNLIIKNSKINVSKEYKDFLSICRGGVDITKNIAEFLIYNNGTVRRFRLPISDLISITGLKNDDRNFVSVCSKNKVARYVGFSSCWSEIELKNNFQDYIIN